MNLIITVIVSVGIFFFILPIIRDAGVEMFLNLDALMIIGSGTLIGLFIGFPFKRIKGVFVHIKESFKGQEDRDTLLRDILVMARIYRRGNIQELEYRLKGVRNDFLKMGLNLLISHHPIEDIKNILEREMAIRIVNYNLSQNILKTLSRLTPALGLAGTIISLVKMFDHFKSIDTMTPMMAVALMSTFYGVIIANLIMLPLSSKIKEQAILSESSMNMTIEALLAINERENPHKIEEKLTGVGGLPEPKVVPIRGNMAWEEMKIGF